MGVCSSQSQSKAYFSNQIKIFSFITGTGTGTGPVLVNLLFLFASRHIELKKDDITVLHDILRPFLTVFSRGFHLLLGSELLQHVERHDFGADETAFEIGVNRTRRLRRLVTFSDAPRLDLV